MASAYAAAVIIVGTINCSQRADSNNVGGENTLRTGNVVDIESYAEAIIHIGKLAERKVAIVISAEAAGSAARVVMMVWTTKLESVVAACLSGVYLVGGAAVSTGVEMAGCAGLRVIAACLHLPK